MASVRRVVASVTSQISISSCRRATPQPTFFQATAKDCLRRPSRPRIATTGVRWHSTPASNTKVYVFEDIKQMAESPSSDRILIDVREPSEVQGGYIPTAINLPIKSQPDALMLPEDEFEDRFGFSKPETDKEVVFYCRSGVRSSAAAHFAQQQGYQRVAEYRGSWLDWQEKGGPASKP